MDRRRRRWINRRPCWRGGRHRGNPGMVGGQGSCRISNDVLVVSQKTYDRSAGKVKARFVIEKITMSAREIPKEFIVHSRFSNGQQLRLTSLGQMRNLSPYATVRN